MNWTEIEWAVNLCSEGLAELACEDLQRELWLSDGCANSQVSSFDEAVETVFSDSGLSDALIKRTTGLDESTISLIDKLSDALQRIDAENDPADLLNHPQLLIVRDLASQILTHLNPPEGPQSCAS